MSTISDTASFVQKASETHGDKYNYTKAVYVNAHTKVTIGCRVHGDFEQLPHDHIRGNGCHLCCHKNNNVDDKFTKRLQQLYGDKFDYSLVVYKGVYELVTLLCPKHGAFSQQPKYLLAGRSCQMCGQEKSITESQARRMTHATFVRKATDKHDHLYLYNNVKFSKSTEKVEITCKQHGAFFQTPQAHLRGQGCPMCGREKKHGVGGYSTGYFKRFPHKCSEPAILYVALVTDGKEKFVKIGITCKSFEERFKRTEYKDMTVVQLFSKYTYLYNAYQEEQYLLQALKAYKFYPNQKFSGYTECLRYNQQVLDVLTERLSTSKSKNKCPT